MIFEQELKDKGFEIKDNQLYYEFSDFELLRARVSEWDCADGTKALKVSDLRLMNPIEEGMAHMMISYSLYFRDINKFYELLTLLGYKIR
jgi:hypothetical protein